MVLNSKNKGSIYGYAKIIKEYANFPKWLPLPCHFEHGWTALNAPLKTDLETNKKLMLVLNRRRKKAWESCSNIPCEIIGSPFIIYRKKNDIRKLENAKGTVVFPAHSTEFIEAHYDIRKFCEQLRGLPDEFHPITICLHWHDVLRGMDKVYEKEGFRVVSAGNMYSDKFPENFYNILKQHKYSASNEPGSYMLYAVEMGIPFFLIGQSARRINKGDPNVPLNFNINEFEIGQVAIELFAERKGYISTEQRNFVIEELGINDTIAPHLLNKLLWRSFFRYIFSPELLKYFIRKIKK